VVLALLSLLLVDCNQTEKHKIKDVSQAELFVIKPETFHNHRIRIYLIGFVNGESVLQLSNDKMDFNVRMPITGNMDTSFLFDWYEENGKLLYKPITTQSGHLKIKCVYYD